MDNNYDSFYYGFITFGKIAIFYRCPRGPVCCADKFLYKVFLIFFFSLEKVVIAAIWTYRTGRTFVKCSSKA